MNISSWRDAYKILNALDLSDPCSWWGDVRLVTGEAEGLEVPRLRMGVKVWIWDHIDRKDLWGDFREVLDYVGNGADQVDFVAWDQARIKREEDLQTVADAFSEGGSRLTLRELRDLSAARALEDYLLIGIVPEEIPSAIAAYHLDLLPVEELASYKYAFQVLGNYWTVRMEEAYRRQLRRGHPLP